MNEELIQKLNFDIKTKNEINLNNNQNNNNNSNNYYNIEKIETKSDLSIKKHSEIYFLFLNATSMIINGINHFHFKYMKKSIGKENYDEYSFTIWRCLFIVILNHFRMKINKEVITPFVILKSNIWFWIRNVIQFVTLEGMLLIIIYFRVATATCFVSMAPVVVIIMSSIILKEKFYMRYLYGTLICFFGVMLIVKNEYEKEDASGKPTGIINLLIGLFWGIVLIVGIALHRVSSKMLIKEKIDMNTQFVYPSLTCIVLSFLFIPLLGRPFKFGFWLLFHSFLNSIIWLICTLIMLISLKGVDLIKTVALGYLGPVTVFTLGALFLGEHFYVSDIIGSLIILGYNLYDTMYPKK